MKYRKKPVEIDAFQWYPDLPVGTAPEWFYEACAVQMIYPEFDGSLTITTPEGNMRGSVGDYIIRGVMGEFYACKPDIFEMTYEKVE